MERSPRSPDRRATSNVLLTIITVFLVGVVLRLARSVILPILVAVFLAYLMDPLMSLLRRLRLPVLAAVLIAAVLFLGVFLVFGYVLYSSGLEFAREIPRYQSAFLAMLRSLFDRIQVATNRLFGLQLLDELKKIPVGSLVVGAVGSLANAVVDFLLIFLFSLLILAGKYGITRKLLRSFPRREGKRIARVLLHIDRDLRMYVGIKSFVSLVVGLGSGVALALFHVQFAVILGFLTFVLNFIPYLGSTIAVILPVLISLIQFGSWTRPLWVLLALLAIQNLVAQVLEPRIVGSGLKISVPVVFFTLFFWGWLWGAAGVLLAVPMTTSLKIVMENVPGAHPFALLLERAPRRGRRI